MKWFLTTCRETGERLFIRRYGRDYMMLLRPDGTQRWHVTTEIAKELCTPCEKLDDHDKLSQDLVAAIERTYLKFFFSPTPSPTPPPRPMGWERRSRVMAEIERKQMAARAA